MKVKIIATKTVGLGCIKGESKIYEVLKVEDKGTYYVLVRHANSEIIVNKDAWKVEIL